MLVRGVTHEIVGVGLDVAAARAVALGFTATDRGGRFGLLGSRLPDVDAARSRVHRRTLLERRVTLVRVAGRVVRVPLRVGPWLRHRGIAHSVLACAVTSLLTALLVWCSMLRSACRSGSV